MSMIVVMMVLFMEIVFQVAGYAMVLQIAMMHLTKQIAEAEQTVVLLVNLNAVMVNVSQLVTTVMVQLKTAMPSGVLTVMMDLMRF